MMKRTLDVSVALLSTILLSPVLFVLFILIRLKLGKPVLFKQPRSGLHGKTFVLYKFRSMTDERDNEGNLLPDGLRLTSFGKTLRKYSLDELPQLFNVLKGDISLVGPRPLLTQYMERYTARQARRHEVYPGVTGWAQINGRNGISWEEKFELDVWYVDHRSFLLDMRIIFLTIIKVLRPEGISQSGHATMEEYRRSEGLERASERLSK